MKLTAVCALAFCLFYAPTSAGGHGSADGGGAVPELVPIGPELPEIKLTETAGH